jgi:hypothetical protein
VLRPRTSSRSDCHRCTTVMTSGWSYDPARASRLMNHGRAKSGPPHPDPGGLFSRRGWPPRSGQFPDFA